MEPIIGEIRMFAGNFAPVGWRICDGSLLSVSENETLYVLLGTNYGGDGMQTFGLPDLRGRVPVYAGAGNGLTPVGLGQMGGSEQLTLKASNLPAHTHALNATTATGTSSDPKGMMMATSADPAAPAYIANVEKTKDQKDLPTPVPMNAASIANAGQNVPVSIMQPYLAINFIIALTGVYPSFND